MTRAKAPVYHVANLERMTKHRTVHQRANRQGPWHARTGLKECACIQEHVVPDLPVSLRIRRRQSYFAPRRPVQLSTATSRNFFEDAKQNQEVRIKKRDRKYNAPYRLLGLY